MSIELRQVQRDLAEERERTARLTRTMKLQTDTIRDALKYLEAVGKL